MKIWKGKRTHHSICKYAYKSIQTVQHTHSKKIFSVYYLIHKTDKEERYVDAHWSDGPNQIVHSMDYWKQNY